MDYIIIAVISAFALGVLYRQMRKSLKGESCSSCNGQCSHCHLDNSNR